jgi:hypothetical protein
MRDKSIMTTPKYIKVKGQVYKLAANSKFYTVGQLLEHFGNKLHQYGAALKRDGEYADQDNQKMYAEARAQIDLLTKRLDELAAQDELKEEPDMEAMDEQARFEMRTRHVGPTERKPWF